jgi:hypothetical protein
MVGVGIVVSSGESGSAVQVGRACSSLCVSGVGGQLAGDVALQANWENAMAVVANKISGNWWDFIMIYSTRILRQIASAFNLAIWKEGTSLLEMFNVSKFPNLSMISKYQQGLDSLRLGCVAAWSYAPSMCIRTLPAAVPTAPDRPSTDICHGYTDDHPLKANAVD